MGLTTIIVLSAVVVALTALVVVSRVSYSRERAAKADGSFAHRFVWVEDSGSARNLAADEIIYLNTEFNPGDGARPYIKASYRSLTPDGRIGGFLLRKRIPGGVLVQNKQQRSA
jgi:hypothetical protein